MLFGSAKGNLLKRPKPVADKFFPRKNQIFRLLVVEARLFGKDGANLRLASPKQQPPLLKLPYCLVAGKSLALGGKYAECQLGKERPAPFPAYRVEVECP